MRHHGPTALVVCCFASAACAVASPEQSSFTLRQALSAPFASSLEASPVGAKVAWFENEEGRRNVWIAAAPDWKAQKITAFNEDDGIELDDLAWAPDATYLLFTRGGDFENGGEIPNPNVSPKTPEQAIWRVDLAGSTAPKKLTDGHAARISPQGDTVVFVKSGQLFSIKPGGGEATPLIQGKGEQSAVEWSPDGSAFVFVSGRGDHSFIGLYDLASKKLRYLDGSVDRDVEPVWSPDGTHLAHLRIAAEGPAVFASHRTGEPWSIRVVDVKTGESHEVFRASDGRGSVFHEVVAKHQIMWTGGNRLVFPWERTGWCHLYSLAAGGGTAVELTPGEGEVEHVTAAPDGSSIFYSSNIGDIDRRHLSEVSPEGNGRPRSLTSGESIEWKPAPLPEKGGVAFLRSSYHEKAHPAVLAGGGSLRALVGESAASEFPARQLVKPQSVLITAADGMVIHGQLFLPPGERTGSQHPALIFFHGGSRRQMLLGFHYMYYYSNAYALNQYLASKGYVVLSVNYRSGIGYGLNFREAINYGVRGASEFNDVIGAGLFLKSRADVDPARIGVWGGSYGGYLTAMALSRASDLFAAGVDFHGVHDWSTLGYVTRGGGSGDPAQLRERQEAARIAFESSPMAFVDTWKSPVLLIHGDDDRNVEFSQTIVLAEALRKRHVPFEQLIFPNEIHDFLRHRDWLEAYTATADFFDRKLKSPAVSAQQREKAVSESR